LAKVARWSCDLALAMRDLLPYASGLQFPRNFNWSPDTPVARAC
jgi:hypothetical protein